MFYFVRWHGLSIRGRKSWQHLFSDESSLMTLKVDRGHCCRHSIHCYFSAVSFNRTFAKNI